MPLNWQASNKGHYSDSVIPAESDVSIDIDVSSYNGVQVKPYKIAVANYNSEYALEFYFGAEPAVYVQPYTNIALDCSNFTRCRIINRGNKKIAMRFVDKKLFDAMPGLFSSFPIQISASRNDILFHFDNSVQTNEGRINGSVEVIPSCSLDTNNKKFGSASLLCSGGGIIVGRSGYIDLANDFTCDAWIKHDMSAFANGTKRYLFQIGSDAAFISLSAKINRIDASHVSSELYLNGGISISSSYVFNYSDFVHVALTKKGNVLRYFENGVLLNSVTKLTTAVSSSIFLGNGVVSGADNNIVGNIDEWRFIKDVCQWTVNFTPPDSPYF